MIASIVQDDLIIGWSHKCGSTSIKTAFLDKMNQPRVPEFSAVHLQFNKHTKHCFKTMDTSQYTKVCFVRNPIERLISGFKHRLMDSWHYHMAYRFLTLRNFIKLLKEFDIDSIERDNWYNTDMKTHFSRQSTKRNFTFEWDHVFQLQVANRVHEFINARYPNMDFPQIKCLNFAPHEPANGFLGDTPLYEIIKSGQKSRHRQDWLDQSMTSDVEQVYKEDFELFAKAENI